MNGGNMQRGQADGFGLEILSKLRDVKVNPMVKINSKNVYISLFVDGHCLIFIYSRKILVLHFCTLL